MIGLVNPDKSLHRHVADQDTGDSEWHTQDR